MSSRLLKRIGFFLGLGLFLWVLRTADLSAVWQQIRHLQWRFGVVLLFYVVIFGLDTFGWRFALSPLAQAKVRWDRLFRARLAGEALNYVTPSAWIGGEPVKAYLLSKRYGVPLSEGMASVVIAKTTFSISMFFFVMTGIGITLATRPLDPSLLRWVWITLIGLGGLLALFLLVQFLRPFEKGSSLFGWMRSSIGPKVREWDEALVRFYRESQRELFLSLGFHFLGWVAGVFEVFLILRFLGIPVTLATAWSLEALWVLLKSGAFLIPASLGASEGLGLLVCMGLGIQAVPGLALALVRRARELVWVGLGLLEFSRR
ncbi:MAG: flippase-like domain-containing protein [Candidatus Omnitrophica bacterium]|nr:flippase-like domain-containing protein [Candidatus Omnitrophota bacterium]